jgi:hypothetical protein
MWPYFLLLAIPLIMVIMRINSTKYISIDSRLNFTWSFIFIYLTFFIGFRYEVGADWEGYLISLHNMQNETFESAILGSDPGYGLLNWVGSNIGGGVYFVNFVCATIFSWGLIAFCRVQTRPWLAFLVAVPYLITVVALGYTRQGVAIGLAMIAITKLMNRQVLSFVFWIVLAALFHKSAVILVPFALFAVTKNRIIMFFALFILTITLFLLLIQEQLDYFAKNYLESEYTSSGGTIRIAMNAGPAILFLLFNNRFKVNPEMRNFWIFMSITAILFVPLLIISPSSTAIDRLALYWIPLQLFILSRFPDAFGVNIQRNSVWVIITVIYCISVMIVWLFFADHAAYWIPYKFYLWEVIWNDLL